MPRCTRVASILLTASLGLTGPATAASPGSEHRAQTAASAADVATVPMPGAPVPALDLVGYMGTWYQVAHYPNRFQRRCVADTKATYTLLADGRVQVINTCRTADGIERVEGIARPRGAVIEQGRLSPASLQVSFLPAWLRWLPVGWGDYDVVYLSSDAQLAIVSEPSRTYLWVLSRSPEPSAMQWAAAEAFLKAAGFDMERLERDPLSSGRQRRPGSKASPARMGP